MSEANRFTAEEWEQRLEGIDLEIARQAMLCKVPLLAPGIVERVLDNDESVCGCRHEVAFKTLRGLLAMHFLEGEHLQASMGTDKAIEVAHQVRKHLSEVLGHEAHRLMVMG